ncbi:unnamed protein product [Hyaloperonospora brassicae]|uniref:Nucleoporin Nup133/Nup155-like N-terminal domain-containing protein n=1 Tax=Hyaloperonospora brassicae TaxID=162125 RepID=A0AAV0V039_HYABA|nr:unnamed protein product [Hyaloperonospora brassicae]
MVRKKTSWKTFIDSRHVHTQHNVKKKDVVVPIVRWNQPPQVEVSSLHVFHLPVSQPSQNSSFVVNEDSGKRSIGVEKQVGARGYQLCVFAGTLDGIILYWRFEQDEVAQVNVLVFPGTGRRRYPIVGLVSGIDEWGQSVLISATRDGEMARWQLPNGACAEANASLAKELSPLLGLEMLCNQRFALVVSEVSRLMVLDTWRMQLMHCVDTAQEQIRRSVAVGELSMSRPKSTQKRVIISTNESNVETNSRDESADQAVNRSAEGQRISPSRSSPAGGIDTLFSTKSATAARQNQRWDAVVLSLGAEGLVKCFLWTQPRGSISGTFSSVTGSNVSADNTRGSWWVQRSSWVISWADQAEDVTCSQSTSLKDGDNLNPQTALMGSIKNSYFPLSVQVSSDSSFVLLIWQTKFAVLKRKWLCPLEARSDVQAHSGQDKMSRTAG